MPRRPDSTLPSRPVPAVVLIAPSAALSEACARMMPYLDEVPRVEVADVKSAATVVASFRPFAVILAEDLFAFDPEEFHALARDVSAELMSVDVAATRDDIVALLFPRLKSALHRWWAREDAS